MKLSDTGSLRPPFVELGFYFADRSTHDAFFQIIDHLTERGAVFGGSALLGETGDPDHIADLTYNYVEKVVVNNKSDLLILHEGVGRAIAGVTLEGVQVGSSKLEVQVRVLPIPAAAIHQDHHPIAIWLDGRAFEPYSAVSAKKRAAAEIIELFTATISVLSPSYAAILFEWPLPSPYEIASQPDGFEFTDFYLSAHYVGQRKIKKISNLVDDSCKKHTASGILYLTSGLFAPKPRNAEDVRVKAALAIVHTHQKKIDSGESS